MERIHRNGMQRTVAAMVVIVGGISQLNIGMTVKDRHDSAGERLTFRFEHSVSELNRYSRSRYCWIRYKNSRMIRVRLDCLGVKPSTWLRLPAVQASREQRLVKARKGWCSDEYRVPLASDGGICSCSDSDFGKRYNCRSVKLSGVSGGITVPPLLSVST